MLDRLLTSVVLLTCLPTLCRCEDYGSDQQAVYFHQDAEDSPSGEEFVLLEDSSQLKDFGITRPGGESIMISMS